jgi:hypothetical protein
MAKAVMDARHEPDNESFELLKFDSLQFWKITS